MKALTSLAALLLAAAGAQAQSCAGGLYLNPQVIRGEGSAQTESALRELVDFLRPTTLSLTPVVNVKDTKDVIAAVGRANPPCWIYGNPVVGLASGYRPVAINTEAIEAAVLVLGDVGGDKDATPRDVASLAPADRAKVLAQLKSTPCYGMKSGVTTALVQAEGLCGSMIEVTPQQGLGQSYLPTKAAFQWQPGRWVGLVTRLQAAQHATLKDMHGADERVHRAQLVVVPVAQSSWGYGLYAHPNAPADAVRKAAVLFTGLRSGPPLLMKALDLGSRFEFASPNDSTVLAMRSSLGVPP